MNKKSIAIFQYDWLLQNYSVDLAIKLRDIGFEVFFYGYDITKYDLTNLDAFTKHGIHFYEFKKKHQFEFDNKSFLIKYLLKLKWLFIKKKHLNKTKNYPFHEMLDREILYQSIKKLEKKEFDYVIGIEKKGIIWAGILSTIIKTKLVYYNLELYLEDHHDHMSWKYFQPFREGEIFYHKKSAATIIQDKFRAKALDDYNKVKTERIYLPVSVPGKALKEKSDYFQQNFSFAPSDYILLYFGVIGPYRYCEEILENSPNLQENVKLVYHGIDFINYIENTLQHKKEYKNAYFSTDKEPDDKIPHLVSSAHIGLALYPNKYCNDRLIAYSSQKIAYYFKCGVPIIAFRNETFEDLYAQFQCVRMIDDIAEIQVACKDIIDEYEKYRQASFDAYEKYYRFENVSGNLEQFFKA